jgi:allantoinase
MLLEAMKDVGKEMPRRPGEDLKGVVGHSSQGPCEWPDVKVHVLHLSSARAVTALKRARRSGALLTVETCPHYLALNKDVIEDGDTRLKVSPPIRDEANCTTLWRALLNGSIDMVVSAHTPTPQHLKVPGDFQRALSGISSIQFSLPLLWTQAQRKGFTEECVAQWMCKNPAKMLGLAGSSTMVSGAVPAWLPLLTNPRMSRRSCNRLQGLPGDRKGCRHCGMEPSQAFPP